MSDQKAYNLKLIEDFRASRGASTDSFAGRPLLLLTTTGAKSGQQRTTPLVYTRDGDRYVIIASKAGAPSHPAWYHNIVATPDVTLEVGPERFTASASVAAGGERDRLYAEQARLMPNFDEYQKATSRQIPVVALERRTS